MVIKTEEDFLASLDRLRHVKEIFRGDYTQKIKTNRHVAKVWMIKANGQKLVTIPKSCDICVGEYVKISRV